ncbi:MAG: hypothetical protein ABIW33_03495 [Sphingomicrobium sp.]
MSSHPLDAMHIAPDHHQLLFENDRVRILDTLVRPGEQTPVHGHQWPAALYVLSWSDFIRRDPQGEVMVDSRDRKLGDTGAGLWIPPLPPHSIENVGSTDLRIIAVEVKG